MRRYTPIVLFSFHISQYTITTCLASCRYTFLSGTREDHIRVRIQGLNKETRRLLLFQPTPNYHWDDVSPFDHPRSSLYSVKIQNAKERVLQPNLDHIWPGEVFERHVGRISLYNCSSSLQQYLDKNKKKKCKPPERT